MKMTPISSRKVVFAVVLGALSSTKAFVPGSNNKSSSTSPVQTTTITPTRLPSSSSTKTRLQSSMFGNTRTSTNTNQNYDMLKQPGVAAESSLTRLDRAPPGGVMRQQQQRYTTGQEDGDSSPQRRLTPVQIQGGSLKTWTFPNPRVESVQVFLKTEGRPLNANIEVWQGPDNTPMQVAVYVEDGSTRPFSAVIGTPRNYPSSISIRNTATMEFPMEALLEPDRDPIEAYTRQALTPRIPSKTVQGGAVHTIPFPPAVQSVAMLLRTDGRPLNARVELLHGPSNNKQVMEVYSEDGLERPFFSILETPGYGNVVRIVNTAVMEFPLTADVQPYMVDDGYDEGLYLQEWENNNRKMGGSAKSRQQKNPYFILS